MASHPFLLQTAELPLFKQPNSQSYTKFREIMQIIDTAILDVETLQHKDRVLVASVMYLTLGKHLGVFSIEQIVSEFPYGSQYILAQTSFNLLYHGFLEFAFGFPIIDIIPTVKYAALFFSLPLVLDAPKTRMQVIY
jgi:hypothetical protein